MWNNDMDKKVRGSQVTTDSAPPERLNKWLSRMGICSRREADRLIDAGRVLVEGCPAAVGQKLLPGQEVVCDGKTVSFDGGLPEPVLLAVNKPRGIVCTTSDRDRAENIVEYLKYPERIYPVGRLDKDSEGLLLMTNQGDLVNKIMRSGNAHEKEYIVTVDRPVTEDFVSQMAKGMYLKELDTFTRRCKVLKAGEDTFSIILTQGLNRQIRRMCMACGFHVKRLVRVRIMNIELGKLKTGESRKLTEEEYRELIMLLGDSSSLPVADYRYLEGTGERNERQDQEDEGTGFHSEGGR